VIRGKSEHSYVLNIEQGSR